MSAKRLQPCLTAFLLCWTLAACAALPDVKNLNNELTPAATPKVITGKGAVLNVNSRAALLNKRWAKSGMDLKTQAALEEAATGVPLIKGNKVTLLFDGPQTMKEMLKAITEAKSTINLETYIFDQDPMGLKFADALIEKQQSGVTVNIIYDSVGTLGVPQAFFDRMRAAGIHLVAFNPVNPAKLKGDEWKINNRDHRKVLIVDGKMAFTGGINISNTYSKSSLFRSKAKPSDKSEVGWRDTHVKIEGPAAAAFQWLFIRTWAQQDRADLPDAPYFPVLPEVGDKLVRVVASEPGGGFEIYKAYILAIQEAKKNHPYHLGLFRAGQADGRRPDRRRQTRRGGQGSAAGGVRQWPGVPCRPRAVRRTAGRRRAHLSLETGRAARQDGRHRRRLVDGRLDQYRHAQLHA